ncbi:hypothetical protein chiPu_0032344 [Chiloscyllium punctatum]|uniref:Calpain catalytic domain-containing protein n=1 Tax=Chiloscyllium punctatum TaxID=137246 RepID=A0A401TZV6_CHIPU|nr:hypothetical protein [Chiloscyllium punctatum]
MPQRVGRYKGQDYRALRRSCQRQRSLFEDPHFPVTNDSIYYTKSPPGTIEWKRPGVRPQTIAQPSAFRENDWRPFGPCTPLSNLFLH